ncbi:hypothetical protein, partial [Streptomyces sp. NPDC047453]|uniref:hypothetical protein n=1 Tax=Streptomyces sp. NPDC047453 TaxID=3154812 RepID=UPI0033CBA6C6
MQADPGRSRRAELHDRREKHEARGPCRGGPFQQGEGCGPVGHTPQDEFARLARGVTGHGQGDVVHLGVPGRDDRTQKPGPQGIHEVGHG